MPSGTMLVEILASLLAVVFLAGGVYLILVQLQHNRQEQQHFVQQRQQLQARIVLKPADARLAWDLANTTLEQYFSRNLQQVRLIFILSVVVMFAGLGIILAGIVLAYTHPQQPTMTTILSTSAGVLTQFIGASFMVVYRSTMDQAQGFSRILARINTVGMAMDIVETIPATDPLYSQIRAQLARELLGDPRWQDETPFAPQSH
ncbi:TRADD-N-associated membrane domain-containing protein [Acidipila rosea]|uniref:Cyanobacterial TRADD-N associated 2 transmembrane domain-containing protein n=1 Tax=Acidipila rosea TaxID=768535 RepID=A0A4R1LC04_9BACT|nr:hypothetical protein [Acidipila rosea]MBW4025816.1 hypothetical protein [Acidobacteriota bacterium]MBW4044265.1 hypothetical protein [Acidobacteriota bacterium]TCK75704.1 hypothetical protein C7378_0695 [Acidipila rosea]